MWYNKLNKQNEQVMAMNDTIRVKGARENNLKNVDLVIPRDKLVVFTGQIGRAHV